MRIVQIRKGELRQAAARYNWTAHAVTTITGIVETWLDSGIAQSVLLFFKEDISGDLHSYMPIIPEDTVAYPAVTSPLGAKGIAKIIGIEPYPLSGAELKKEDFDIITRTLRDNYWNGNEAFRMSDNNAVQEFETDEVTWKALKYGRDKIRAVKEKTGRTPAHLVRAVEMMQREYDEATGFAQCQMESHAFTIRLDSLVNKGRFMAEDLIRFLQKQFDLFNIANPGESKNYTVHLAGFVPGSSCLVGDYDVIPDQAEKADKFKLKEDILKAEKRMTAIIEAAPVLVDKSKAPAERVTAFKKATGLSNEAAYAAMQDISKLRAPHQTVELYSKDSSDREKARASVRINGTAVRQLAETKRALAAIISPSDERKLVGKIVELEHYKDDDLKFGIFVEDEARLYTVHYPRREDKVVRARKGEVATLTVLREGPNKPWYFQKWS